MHSTTSRAPRRASAFRHFGWLASAALATLALVGPASALSGAVFTSNVDGSVINENVGYLAKSDVYLTGGPCNGGSHLEPGDYYFEVKSPNGVLLSSDAIGNRRFTVGENGFIATTSGTHAVHAVNCDPPRTGVTVQLIPFLDTPNPGGEYKLTVATASSVEACSGFSPASTSFEICNKAEHKSDNFKVRKPGSLTITKAITGDSAAFPGGTFEFGVDCSPLGTFTASITIAANGTGGSATISGIPAGASCSVSETSVPAAGTDYQWLTATISPNPVIIASDATVTVTVKNPRDFIVGPQSARLVIHKLLDIDPSKAEDFVDGEGWSFVVAGDADEDGVTGTDGLVAFTFDELDGPLTVDVSETIDLGEDDAPLFTLVRASCRVQGDARGTVDLADDAVNGVTISPGETVTCEFVNESGEEAGVTATPRITPPPTAWLPASGTPDGRAARIALLAIAGLLAMVMLLTPASRVKARNRR